MEKVKVPLYLQGQGEYNDNGTYRPVVKAGDITFNNFDNHGHALAKYRKYRSGFYGSDH